MSHEPCPFIVRVAGLPASVLQDFADPACIDQLARIRALEADSAVRRQAVVDWLFGQLPSLDPDVRRDALALKRDCFNGRSIDRHRRRRHWPRFTQLPGGEVLSQLGDHEDALAAARERFDARYTSQLEAERRSLIQHMDHPEFRRGLALSSPLLIRQLARLARKPVDAYGRRERKAERSALRYLSRAAAKLSPYSTLTKLGLGMAPPEGPSPNAQFVGAAWQERSLMRAKRYLIDQCTELLLRHPAVRGQVSIVVNETLEDLGDGRFRFLRPFSMKLDAEAQQLRTVQPSQVTVKLNGALIDWLRQTLDAPMNHAQCVDALIEAFDAADDPELEKVLRAHLEKFLDIGFLVQRYPWSSYEPHLEQRLLAFLENLPERAQLAQPIAVLRRLVDLERGFAAADDPSAALAAIEAAIPELFDAVKAVIDLEASVRLERHESHNIYEDIFVTAGDTPNGEIAQLSHSRAKEILQAGDLMWQLGFLFEKKHDFIFALDELMRSRWPERETIPFLALFTEAKALWSAYLTHLAEMRTEAFNPYGLPVVEALEQHRERVRLGIDQLETPADVGLALPMDGLTALLDEVPARYRPPVGPCLFVQATDRSGEQWMAHRMFEGSGRFSSRFTPLMTGDVLDGYIDRFLARSQVEDGLGTGELVDTIFTRGNTVNLHWPQTPRILETPGEYTTLPAERRLAVRDLSIRRGQARGALTIEDRDGKRVIPCYLSNLHNAFIPSLLKFLDVFGTVARGGFGPRNMSAEVDGAYVLPRMTIGPLVVRRQHWYVQPENVPDLTACEGAEAFAQLDDWRRRLGLPDRVYLIEKVANKSMAGDVFKPQLLDFRSPSFMAIFQTALAAAAGRQVVLVEALPDPDDFPIDGSGEPRGLELMLEALAFENATTETSPSPSAAAREVGVDP
ncbi:MAG: lantibiotic dehydratase [Acidobacteriota bacterium]